MNYLVYVNGVLLPKVDTILTTDDYLWFHQAPPMGAQIVLQIIDGWNQGFVGDGFTNNFPLSKAILESIDQQMDNQFLKHKQTLHDAMRHLDNAVVQAEVERLATVMAMIREYNTN
jgi:hypothetical protein